MTTTTANLAGLLEGYFSRRLMHVDFHEEVIH